MESLLINVTGKVQGVGFRYFCLSLALKYNLKGSAKNLDDGSVTIVLQGSIDSIDTFLAEMLKGNKFIKITNYSTKKIPTDLTLKKFNIVY